MSGELRFFRFDTGQVSLNVAEMGDPAKPLIVCLHGFPEYWAAWEGVMRALSADFHVVAPDQRGFNLSDKPQGVDAYRSKHIVADLAALADRLSPGRPFVLAGHDWGASIAYAFAFAHPDRLSHLVIANGVHPALFQRAISNDTEQRRASQYMNRLRADGAEARMAEDDYRRTFNMLSGFSKTKWMTADERVRYLEAWSRPGAMTGMLNWYRASPIAVPAVGEPAIPSPIDDMPREALLVRMPHLLIWGEADEALRPATIDGLGDYAPQLTVKRFADSGHWILHEQPQAVADAIRDFVR